MKTESFLKPPRTLNAEGEPRRVGFEFEFDGVELPDCIQIIQNLYGGESVVHNPLSAEVRDTRLGDFKVELDSPAIRKFTYPEPENAQDAEGRRFIRSDKIDIDRILAETRAWLGERVASLLPLEIVCPPLQLDRLDELEKLRARLHEANAQGTDSAWTHAFGVHINPELPDLKVRTILNYLRAFLLLYPWLKKVMQVDFSRRLLTYIDRFSEDYEILVLSDAYDPDRRQFFVDYLTHNPSRNRALDLLPLMVHTEPELRDQLREQERKLAKPRPTFHYRLPNCEINDPDWRVARDWNYWVRVEQLAENPDLLKQLSLAYLSFLDRPFHTWSDDWIDRIDQTSELVSS